MDKSDKLFESGELTGFLDIWKQDLLKEIDQVARDYILGVSPTDLCDHLAEKYYLEVPSLREDDIEIIDYGELSIPHGYGGKYPGKGTFVTFAVPFDGSAKLFYYQPSTRDMSSSPNGRVGEDGALHLSYVRADHDEGTLRKMLEADVAAIRKYLTWVANNVKPFDDQLVSLIEKRIAARRRKLLDDDGLVEALGFPMRKRDDVPHTYAVPVKRKSPAIERPKATSVPYKPEPELAMNEYENILDIVSNMVTVMERSPRAFVDMEEEDLRQHFLVQLNGQYNGQATGETFNYQGKTDILIRADGKNIFIAECKFWRGKKALLQTIDQSLGYASWRDTKTAIILFNRNKELSGVLKSIPDAVKSHPNYKRDKEYPSETGFRYVLHHKDDKNRELLLTIMVFDVPQSAESREADSVGLPDT